MTTCLLALAAAVVLGGCSKLSDVGDQEKADTPPDAVITVVGHPATEASGKVTVQVRSGGEVLLSGKDSIETVLPILVFDWQMRNAAAQGLPIVRRNNSSIAFQVPVVQQTTTLELRLVVTDSNNHSDSKDVDVVVSPVVDPNRFLTYFGTPATFAVVAVTSQDLPPCATPGQQNCLSTDVPFRINVETTARYFDIDGNFNDGAAGSANAAVVIDSRSFDGAWLASLGASTNCSAAENPSFSLPIPAYDADEIAAAVQAATPRRIADASRIDDAELAINITISQPAGAAALPAGTRQVCVPAFSATPATIAGTAPLTKSTLRSLRAPDGAATQVRFTVEELLEEVVADAEQVAGTAIQDTRARAQAYYATIDTPQDAALKATFSGWLKANGFLPAETTGAVNWTAVAAGSDSNSVYVNNFDLGFGRDMYARKFNCDHAGPDFQPGECDVASVVVNYASLEGAAKKLGPQLIVAMEYRRKGDSGARFVKFYTYAPNVSCDAGNEQCAQFQRVLSANLDGRGEKFMPATCTVCHGGTPLGLDSQGAYANGGDVNASFLPWDLKSLLFSDDAAAGFLDDSFDTTHHQLWLQGRKSEQVASLKALNQLAYLTYYDLPGREQRYALQRQLVDGWYANGDFDEGFAPPQWSTTTDEEALYHDVFAQYCRSCHTAQVPNAAPMGISGFDPFSKCGPGEAASGYGGSNHQIVFGCYQQLVNTGSLPLRIGQGVMPAARLTLDRFWVSPGTSAAQSLSEHLNVPLESLTPRLRATLDLASVALPGNSAEMRSFDPDTGNLDVAERGSIIRLLGSIEPVASEFSWSVFAPGGEAVTLAGAAGLTPNFLAPSPGIYAIAFTVGGTTLERSINIPNWLPVPKNDATTAGPSQRVTIDVLANDKVVRDAGATTESNLSEGDGPYLVELCSSATQCGRGAVVTANGRFEFDTATSNVVAYTPNSGFNGMATLQYRLSDVDGESALASLTVTVQSQLVANDRCIRVEATQAFSPIVLQVTGGVAPYSISFSPVIAGLAPISGVNTYRYQSPLLNTSTTPQIFTGSLSTNYTARDSGGGAQQSDTAQLAVKVFPQRPWANSTANGIKDVLQAMQTAVGCGTDCHTSATGEPLRLDGNLDTDFTNLRNLTVGGLPVINLSSPASSLLLRCPVDSGQTCPPNTAHVKAFNTSDPRYQQLLRWIQEGALKNSSTDAAYNCP